MKSKKYSSIFTKAALVLGSLILAASTSLAADVSVNLVALESDATMPDGATVPMWGFFEDVGQECNSRPVWDVGPQISAGNAPADTLTVSVRNCLSSPVSLFIAGQAASGEPVWNGNRVRSFGSEAVTGATTVYSWKGLKAGTYLYQSGTHPALQVPMGLYGALVVDPPVAGRAYTPSATNGDTAYTTEVVLLYSEIDADLHNPPGVAQPLNYIPEYYLINGHPYQAGDLYIAGNVGESTLIRFLNAGLKTHVPTLLNAPYMHLIAEDGNLYPFSREQYTVPLPAGKTIDVIWYPDIEGTFSLVDSANYLTDAGVTGGGMLAQLQVGAATGNGGPVAMNDNAVVAEGGMVTIDVLDNDSGGSQVELVDAASFGLTTINADQTITYSHDGGPSTADSFTYRILDTNGVSSNVATVSLAISQVNDPPVAVGNSYNALAGVALTVGAPGVLGNDSDADGDPLTAALVGNVSGGSLTLNADGSLTYIANNGTTSDSFTYTASDGTVQSAPATVTFSVTTPVNTAPVAVDDYATTTRNTALFINITANDTDAENNLKDGSGNVAASQINIVREPTKGGIVTVLNNGVTFTPKTNFRGTDVFTYTVTDLDGKKSNRAKVRVNVTR
jgi:FtsP/CotA-like multicopper oxidase with cupredoxin domain